MKNRISFKIKTGLYLELLTPGTMKLLASTNSKISKIENGENVSNLENTKVALVHCENVNKYF